MVSACEEASAPPLTEPIDPDALAVAAALLLAEGVLRALHRREAPAPRFERRTWPYRTFARADAAPMPPGRAALLRFGLLPTSWLFKAGSRIRVAIAGADVDHYVQTPHGRPPVLTVHRGPDCLSAIDLPWREPRSP